MSLDKYYGDGDGDYVHVDEPLHAHVPGNRLLLNLIFLGYEWVFDFVLSNPTWDQYKLINSALATFLVQNGCTDNSVSEIYLNQLFTPSKSF